MAAFLGAGITHFPRLVGPDHMMADTLTRVLEDPALDPALRDPASWPEQLRAEYGEDRGLAAAAEHRRRLVENLSRVRAEIDRFQPDAVIVWGDDQYENFREDCIPPYSVLAYESTVNTPWTKLKRFGPNVWGEPEDTEVHIRGARSIAKELVGGLLGEGIDISYSYEPKHEPGLSHAFLNSVLFLDHDRTGFDYPVIPIAINCYGRKVICQKGGIPSLTDTLAPEDLDPPGPTPWRCFDMGAAIARVFARTDLRIALVASASWSHGFLAEKNHFLWPDEEADRRLYEAMKVGDFSVWRETSAASVEDAGQHEILNWMALMGAMSELDLTPDWTDLVETYAFNSNKAFALFGSGAGA
jgi:hypothetical protein